MEAQKKSAPDTITKAERRLAGACVLCGGSDGYNELTFPIVDQAGVINYIHLSHCKKCGGGYW